MEMLVQEAYYLVGLILIKDIIFNKQIQKLALMTLSFSHNSPQILIWNQ